MFPPARRDFGGDPLQRRHNRIRFQRNGALVRKLAIALLLVLSACRRQVEVGSPATGTVGAATPREAVQRFMAAAKAQDLEAMSVIWGSAAGPARATMSRETWEMREVVMMSCLKHDSYRVVGEAPAAGGERLLLLELKYQDLTKTTNFTATRESSSGRWFVGAVEMDPIREICSRKT